ncbi:MAG: SPOR domain-containing protein [Bacteroidales bacterium]|nr:SPOR domain-containing protein [Bacteroidales bacterium]
MITNYLKELLNDNECVIIPEFGAFISKRHSATIDYANHRFLPPYKEIVFNDKLKNDDGILADFISKKENISKEEASNKIHEFVNQSVAILDVNSELELVDLGKFININGNFIFNAKDDVNILGDSFGLTEFNYQPVFRTETYQVIKEKIVVEQKEKNTDYTLAVESVEELTSTTTRRRPSLFRTVAVTTLAFFLVFVINWTTEKTDSNLASWNPFLYSSPNEFLIGISETQNIKDTESQSLKDTEIQNLGDLETQSLGDSKDQSLGDLETQGLGALETQENNSAPQELGDLDSQTSSDSQVLSFSDSKYYIIGGSFQAEASAEKCLESIKKQGFEKASILDKNDKGYIRVYYESFADKADALSRLDAIKSEYNESAWLLFQK